MSEIKTWAFWRAFLAESLGMMIFVFIGLSAAIGDRNNTYPDQEIKVAFAFGLAIATLAQSIGHISGAHLNPAITLGLLASCQMSILRALFYVIAQILGAVAGSAFVNAIRPEIIDSLGVNKLNGVSPSQGFAIEFLLTFQLVLCVLAVTDKRRDVAGFAPLAIGLSVGLGHLAGVSASRHSLTSRPSLISILGWIVSPSYCGLIQWICIRYTGCGINPARSFGPAIILQSFDDHWVYWAGPMSASVVAALLYNYVLTSSHESFREKTRALFCGGSSPESENREPLLEHVEDVKWSKEPGV
ncbi:aquaporin-1-like [Solea senegalensis]|uniref:Aquaporin-1-like n=1 Tax=Solea senegalensis TaxID=28829 RepID=A0AAV6T6D0_SOLSE|nr:aquaporin-1-like [Solea senegalensis]